MGTTELLEDSDIVFRLLLPWLQNTCSRAEVAVLPEKISNQTENFWKNTENFMRF